MRRTTFLVSAISCLLLAVAIAMNRELFFFAKTTYVVEWTRPFGDPYIASSVLVMLSLLPAVWLPTSYYAAFKAWGAALALAPLVAVVWLFADSSLGNMFFQYVWATMLGCLPAALLTLILSFAVRSWLRKRRTQPK